MICSIDGDRVLRNRKIEGLKKLDIHLVVCDNIKLIDNSTLVVTIEI